MDSARALQISDTLWANYHRLAEQVDLELMGPETVDMYLDKPVGPFIRAAWFGRLGYIISVWSLWEYYARTFCERLPIKAYGGNGSCVDKVGRALGANNISFPRRAWFSGANALRNIIAHYGGLVIESRACEYLTRAKEVAFPDLELFPDHCVRLRPDTASAFRYEIGEFIRRTP